MLRVVAWDDRRCVQPLEAVAQLWLQERGQGIAITRRPLTAFNDQPLSELADICDVMVIDYPHIAQALGEGIVIGLESLLDQATLSAHARDAVGRAHESFTVNRQQGALASDAACQVAAYRPNVLDELGRTPPRTWDEVADLARSHPGAVALPLYHTDAISCLFSLTAGETAAPDGGGGFFGNRSAAERGAILLRELSSLVDEICWSCTPQALYAHAGKGTTVAYVPLTFGYIWLTAAQAGGWRFTAPPQGCGSLLGGAGMAVSARAKEPKTAASFASWYCSGPIQTLAARHGGQPASRTAWLDADADRAVAGFFSATLETQASAYVRPRLAWWPGLQTEAGQILVSELRARESAGAIVDALEACYARHRR